MCTSGYVVAEISGRVGLITLSRAKALNALSLPMVRDLAQVLQAWREDPAVMAVAIRGMGRSKDGSEQPFGAFSAGGDIRFFHQAALAGDADLDAFFVEEYALNHLIHRYPKPYIAFMDGIVFGGGMGITQGGSHRIVTERTKMAMPETAIGLFPDVGGGYFLSRCPGAMGEYLALTGQVIGAGQAVAAGLADGTVPSAELEALWQELATMPFENSQDVGSHVATKFIAKEHANTPATGDIDSFFALESVPAILQALESASSTWAADTAAVLRRRSPLMLHVVLRQIRQARSMGLADDLRMELGLVHQCFHLREGAASETVEGIRAVVIDKDHAPKWRPARVEDVDASMVDAFFASPWNPADHPLRDLN